MNTHDKRSIIGEPLDRVDGPLKVTGGATYAADWRGQAPHLIGYIVESPVASGVVRSIDISAAEAAEGVAAVLTHENTPPQRPFGEPEDAGRFAQSHAMMRSGRIRHYGYPVAFVVAATLEQARHAATLVRAEIEAGDAILDAFAHEDLAEKPDGLDGSPHPDTDSGDFDAAFAATVHRFEAEIVTPSQHAAAMEPHATVAQWDGDRLTVHMSIQIVADARKAFANTFSIPVENVRIVSPYIGGGFGSKLGVHNEAVLAALAARKLAKPVRIAQHRRHLFANGPHRTQHLHRLKLGADADGRLLAVSHEVLAAMARDYPFAEPVASPTRASYAARAIRTRHRIVKADIPKVDSMRAPGEAIGTLTYETAIDELAQTCGLDPLDFRLLNEPEIDPTSGKPFSKRSLAECLEEGAQRYGWRDRSESGERQGDWLIGHGMAAAIRPNFLQKAAADIEVTPDGRAVARLDMTDIGTGTYTILTQVVAETLGIEVGNVRVELGDSDFAETCGSGGSFGAGSTATAVLDACNRLKADMIARAAGRDRAWQGVNAADLAFDGAAIRLGSRTMQLADLMDGAERLAARGEAAPGKAHEELAQYSYGAQFAEIGVDRVSGEIRVRRMVGVFDAGRILNAKTARSQLMGGMIFGIGAALMEESLMDMRFGSFMNRDLAEYHIPVNRDVPRLDVHMRDSFDGNSNPLGSRGLGELGICGAGPAIANAVRNATGIPIRAFPIHLEDVLAALPRL